MSKRNNRRLSKDIAIVGMSGRFPGARNIAEFWRNLREGVESISVFSAKELAASGVDPSSLENANFVPAGSVIEDTELFDAPFFGFSPREAESLDPQQRIFLECAWHALEDAGYDPETYPGLIGVYGGCAMSTYLYHLQSNPAFMALLGYLQVYIGNDKDYLTTHTSYKLNLKGPSFSVQTACSTSLLAVAVACDGLLSHQCDMALAGGVCVRVPQKTGYYFEPGGIFSPDGHCRVFDERAEGVVFGNGVGIVVLKRLADALADGDSIDAVVKGWAVNNDGSAKATYTAPGLQGQADVVSRAQLRAGTRPGTITYVETHGTGTSLGDPIEIAALTQVFRAGTMKKNFCAVGSVKSNVGHLDPAAGVASLIKTVLALKHKQIPASLNCERPNPNIDFANSPFYVNSKLSQWKVSQGPRRAGVSAFGIGGTNVHVVLQEAPALESAESRRPDQLLALSGRSNSALDTAVSNLVEYLEQNGADKSADLAYTLQVGRRAFNHRCAVVYQDLDDLVKALKVRDPRRFLIATQAPRQRSIVFMFSGQGSQYVNMALDLYRVEATFRSNLDRCSELLKPQLGLDLRAVLYPAAEQVEASAHWLTQTQITQPALFAIEYSLAQLWMEWGIRPDAMIGHSIGEYVAACLAGVFSLEDALALIVQRGRLMQDLPGGSMLSVPLPERELEPFLDGKLDLAATNEVSLCVVSGPTADIEQLQTRLSEQGLDSRRLHTSHAFHSQMMDAILRPFTEKVAQTALNSPRIPYVSNVTGDWIESSEATSPDYWARHLRQPVRFAEGLRVVLKEQDRVLLEVGPGQSLSTFARRHPDRVAGQLVLSSLRHPQERHADTAFLLSTLARLWLLGIRVDWPGFHIHERRQRIHLPVYPFERQRYWADLPDASESSSPVIVKEADIADWFYVPSWEYAISPESDSETTPAETCCWLVFEDDCGVGHEIVNQLLGEGHDVITVIAASEYYEAGSRTYKINPRQPEDYLALFSKLRGLKRLPKKIVHLWSIGSTDDKRSELELFEYYQEAGFYSLLYIAQALVRLNLTDPVQIGAVSNEMHSVTGEEHICPASATILGACKSIPQEYPNITCCNIDIVVQVESRRTIERSAREIIAELRGSPPHPVVAYRGGQRWVQTFGPLRLEESPETIPVLRQSGVYLITGGLGNIGLTLAEDLARSVQAKLVLVGRSNFPAKQNWKEWLEAHDARDGTSLRIRRLQEIEDLGSEVLIISADVADEGQMNGAMDRAYAEFGSLHGVIHGAGNIASNAFFAIDQADHDLCERQFKAKARGLIVLEQVLRKKDLDFVVLLSSVSSVLAGLGYLAYSAGNIFMDAFAGKQNQTSGIPWISIDWDTWHFPDASTTTTDLGPEDLAMYPEEGVEAFRRILSSWLPQVVVSTGDLQARIDQWINLSSLRSAQEARERQSSRLHARPELANPYIAPRNDVEHAIAEVWQQTLGVAQVGVLDNFFTDLNGSSLLATQLVSQLRTRFQVELPLRRFFEGPTVADLAAAISPQSESELGRTPMRELVDISPL
jgi:acyl transferase domain-containing protein/acyl carrier protein